MNKIIIGRILKPQGLRGEVKAEISLAGEYLDGLKSVYLEGEARAAAIRNISLRGGFAYFLLEGVTDIDAAEALRGKALSVPRSAIGLKKGEYLHSDLIGLKVLDETGREYGAVAAIDSYGAANVYTVSGGGKTMRFPFVKKLSAVIDTDAKTMAVDSSALAEVAVYEE